MGRHICNKFFIVFFVEKIETKLLLNKADPLGGIFNFIFLIFQDRSSWGWFYTFDILSIIFFTIFPYLVINKKPTFLLVLLFLVALTNREDAIFIAFYIAISAFLLQSGWLFLRLKSLGRLTLGAALGLFAITYTKYVRDYVSILKPTGADFALGNSVTSLKTGFYNLFIRNFSLDGDPHLFNAPDGFWLIGSVIAVCSTYFKVS